MKVLGQCIEIESNKHQKTSNKINIFIFMRKTKNRSQEFLIDYREDMRELHVKGKNAKFFKAFFYSLV